MKNKHSMISMTILVLLLLVEILITLQIWQLNIVPFKYFLFIGAAVILLDLLIANLLLSGTKNKKAWHRAVGYILTVLIAAALVFVSRGISKIQETMDAVTQTTEVSAVVELYVLQKDDAEVLEDAADYQIAMTEGFDQENLKITLTAMENSLGKTVQSVNYDNVFAMVDALYAEEVDALLINSAYVDIITELENYMDFPERVKCIWQYDVHQIVETEAEENTEIQAAEDISEYAPFVVYISGSDTRSKKLKTSRSDVNILAVVNPATEQILLVNTPRDYYIGNPAGNGALDKLTHCGIYGVDCSMKALADLYDEEIRYYGQINFTGFEKLIDAIGGVDVYSEVAFTTSHGKYGIQKGMNHLNGKQALGFARDRYSLKSGDNARGQNQMKVIKAVVEQISAGNILTNYSEIMDSLQGMFATNISADKISGLAKLQLSEMIRWDVKSYAVTGRGDSQRTYSMPGANAYVMRPNQETVELAIELIDKVMAGEVLTDEDLKI